MKARRKGTNNPYTEIEKVQLKDSDIMFNIDVMEFEGHAEDFPRKEEILDDTYWQEVRNQAAIAAMQGMLANPELSEQTPSYTINKAIGLACRLIEELQKK